MRHSLLELFGAYGHILSIEVSRQPMVSKVGRSKNGMQYKAGMPFHKVIAFIVFEEKSAAIAARKLNGYNHVEAKAPARLSGCSCPLYKSKSRLAVGIFGILPNVSPTAIQRLSNTRRPSNS